ncbi:MAG: hypothetical protein KDE48_00180 [Anaerolineales bacterium]|nr:hypothetical protein [Anaerolineales bacterium]
MSSLFSFITPPNTEIEPMPAVSTAVVPHPADQPLTLASFAATAVPAIPHGAPSQEAVLDQIRARLTPFLPASSDSLPDANISFITAKEKPTGLGNHIGQERLSHFAFALKAGRLEAIIRFQLWAQTPNEADTAVDTLHAHLLDAKTGLLTPDPTSDMPAARFLRFAATQSPVGEHIESLSAWRRTAEYTLLYEYPYIDADDAQSLIAQIPIHTDPDELDSPDRETAVVTDKMVRWDQESAPALAIHTRQTVHHFSVLTFVPAAAPSGSVRLLRTYTDAINPPVVLPDLAQFVTAVTDPNTPTRNAQVTFATFNDFLAVITITNDPIELGDWDEDANLDSYEPGLLEFSTPISLPNATDRLILIYDPDSTNPKFDQTAVIYIQAG